ncbi:MAG: serine/threonine-protein kinase [Archangium sp.]|nr:serine/threonine-protein kinase [Archangium sp.]
MAKQPATDTLASGDTLLAERSPSEASLAPLPEERYRVDEQAHDALLGRGGQGSVWRAHDSVLNREVALKKIHGDVVTDPSVVAAFLREARLTARLEHPGIVPLYDVGRGADGALFLAMRRIEGKSLADTIASAAGLDGRLALVPALVRACQAVAFAHERGVVHRDLKPQNIMLGRFGETYVLDWGLALLESRAGVPHASEVVGTPAYMSPEQAQGQPADARSDVWGLGACLYSLLTGQAPISGRTVQSAVGHAAQAEVGPVLALEPLAPPDLAVICEKALSRERAQRYVDASALAADLEAWLAGRTISARTYSRTELLRRALFANRRMVSVVALGLAVLGGVLVFDEVRVRQERNEARTFVRELIRELPQQVEASHANVALINTLTARTQKWLGRTDLSVEEMQEACVVLSALASFNADVSDWASARTLYARASELGLQGLALQPGDVRFVACEVDAKAGLGYAVTEGGDPAGALPLYEDAWQRLQAWRGELTPELRLARAELGVHWGNWAWQRDPQKGRQLYLDAAETAAPLLTSPDVRVRHAALTAGSNAPAALRAQGRLPEAVDLSRRFYEAAAPDCASRTLNGQRACMLPLANYAAVLAWAERPEAAAMRERALAVDAFMYTHDVDSTSMLHDSMALHLELGLFAEATQRARRLRESESAPWGVEMGPLAAVMAGNLAEVDAWEPLLGQSQSAGPLALGLRDAARGQYAGAARHLRAVKTERLWYDISWTPHPAPALELPEAARPAFSRFLGDFTRAYGTADMKGLVESVEGLAAALEALAR